MRLALGVLGAAACLSVAAMAQEPGVTAPPMSEQPSIPEVQQPPAEQHHHRGAASDPQADSPPEPPPSAPLPVEAERQQEPTDGLDQAEGNQDAVGDAGPRSLAWVALPADLKFTEALATAAAAFAVFVAYLQVRVARRQADIADAQRAIAADQATIMAAQREIAAEQTVILKAQAHTAQALADLELPAVFIFRVDGPALEAVPGTQRPDGARQLSATLHFANYGRTPAIIEEFQTALIVGERLPLIPTYDRIGRVLSPDLLLPGLENAKRWHVASTPLSDDALSRFERREAIANAYGRIVYRDVFGNRSAAGFGFISVAGDPGFMQMPVGDYNYRRPHVG